MIFSLPFSVSSFPNIGKKNEETGNDLRLNPLNHLEHRRPTFVAQRIGNLLKTLALIAHLKSKFYALISLILTLLIASIVYATFPFSFFQFSVLITIFVV